MLLEDVGPEQSWNENSQFVPSMFQECSMSVPSLFQFTVCSDNVPFLWHFVPSLFQPQVLHKLGTQGFTQFVPRLCRLTIIRKGLNGRIHHLFQLCSFSNLLAPTLFYNCSHSNFVPSLIREYVTKRSSAKIPTLFHLCSHSNFVPSLFSFQLCSIILQW